MSSAEEPIRQETRPEKEEESTVGEPKKDEPQHANDKKASAAGRCWEGVGKSSYDLELLSRTQFQFS
jgi:hypothetical protein